MKFMLLNGPNLNMLGIREKEIYGQASYEDLLAKALSWAAENDVTLECRQSNHEGVLIDWIQEAYFEKYDGVVINPGGYTHTSIALADAIKAISPLPVVEVHISDVDSREDFRRVSYCRAVCAATIAGHGSDGYIEALELLKSLALRK